MALSMNGQRYRKMLYFPRRPQHCRFGGADFRRALPFLSLFLTSLMPFAESFLRGTAEGLSIPAPAAGTAGVGGSSLLCPPPRGDLVLRSPVCSSRRKPQPWGSCPEQRCRGAPCLQDGSFLTLCITGLGSFSKPPALSPACLPWSLLLPPGSCHRRGCVGTGLSLKSV